MSGLSARQRELVAASAAVASRTRRGIEEAAGRPAAPGDVFVLTARADLPVEWLLLERPDPEGPFLAVAGDSHPFLGSADLEVETSAGRLSLRGRARARLDPERLDPHRRVATVEPGELEKVRETLAELERHRPPAGSLAAEADAAPDYRQWLLEVVDPARTAAEERGVVLPFPTPAPRRRRSGPALYGAAAAAVLLVATGLLGAWALSEQRRADRLATQERAAREALTASRLEQEGANRSLEELRREQRSETGELRRRIAELEKTATAPPQPLLNLPVALLLPDETLRGDPPALRLPAGSPFLVVVLRFRETPGASTYRVTLTPRGAKQPTWRGDGLTRSAEGAVHLALPPQLVPPGGYELRLFRLRDGQEELEAQYSLQVKP